MALFSDRESAAHQLAQLVKAKGIADPLIFAIPRGGVPLASVIAKELGTDFEVLVTRKIAYPGQPGFGIGAMSEDERAFLTKDINYADPRILEMINEERHELRRRVSLYRHGLRLPKVKDRNCIIIDDGFVSGDSALAAGKFLKGKGAKSVSLAVPMSPWNDGSLLPQYIDQVICCHYVETLNSVEECYDTYPEVSDQKVLELLGRNGLTEMQPFWNA